MRLGGTDSSHATGCVEAGGYEVTVGRSGGTVIRMTARAPQGLGDDVRETIAYDGRPALGEQIDAAVDSGAAVAAKVETASKLFTALAQGRVLDGAVIGREIDLLLGALDRLDREGRFEDALRLARSLSGVLMLTLRCVALVGTLKVAFRAATALADTPAIAAAQHELGTLATVAGDHRTARRELDEALRLRDSIGDKAGAAATKGNLKVLDGAVASPPSDTGGLLARIPRNLAIAAGAAAIGVVIVLALSTDLDRTASSSSQGGPAAAESAQRDDAKGPGAVRDGSKALTRNGDNLDVQITQAPAALVTIERTGRQAETSASASFAFAAPDAIGYSCTLDQGPPIDCSSGAWTGTVGLGYHDFTVTAQGRDGARGPVATHSWSVVEGESPEPEPATPSEDTGAVPNDGLYRTEPPTDPDLFSPEPEPAGPK